MSVPGRSQARLDVATEVVSTDDGNGDVPLPGWALALLGATLMRSVFRRRPR